LHRYAPTGIRFKPNTSAITVVLTSAGYPGDYETGKPIFFPQYLSNHGHVFHAGTKVLSDQTKVTHGGRVLNVTAIGDNLEQARERAYEIAGQIRFDGKYFRRDIAAAPAQALNR
jgi:phosphoribosylamine--glycine ligase